MERGFVTPKVVFSRCLGFDSCRWDGASVPNGFAERLIAYTETVTVCPELEIGLGVPRDPIKIVKEDEGQRLLQLNTEKDLTRRMEDFARSYLKSLGEVDGFLLKERSPSCGIREVGICAGLRSEEIIAKTSGLFARQVLDTFKSAAVESEERLADMRIREHFLTKLFTLSSFRKVHSSADLGCFHSRNSFLFASYSGKEEAAMARIAANREGRTASETFVDYARHLAAALSHPPRRTSCVNILTECLGHVIKRLCQSEKREFMVALDGYSRLCLPLNAPRLLLKNHVERLGADTLVDQSFMEPYPSELAAEM